MSDRETPPKNRAHPSPGEVHDTAASRAAAKRPEPGSKEARLAEALRANLKRRKAAARKPAKGEGTPEGEASGASTAQAPDISPTRDAKRS